MAQIKFVIINLNHKKNQWLVMKKYLKMFGGAQDHFSHVKYITELSLDVL